MQWLLLGVVVVALLFMSSRFPRTAFSILGALALAAAVIVFSTRDDAQLGRYKLPVGDITIENPVISPAYGGGYQFNARLANANREVLLKEAVVSITMLDCPAAAAGDDDCAVDWPGRRARQHPNPRGPSARCFAHGVIHRRESRRRAAMALQDYRDAQLRLSRARLLFVARWR